MPFTVLLTEDAERDVEELHDYLSRHEVPGRADHVLNELAKAFDGLSESPRRGVVPRELQALGIREYREVFLKPYRVIYRVQESNVHVMLVVDGRRDLQALLQRRLLRAH